MKKFASVLVMSVLLASFLLAGVAFAQTGTGTNAESVTVTVTMTEDAVTLSPDTVTAGQEVNFEFAEGDTDMANYCVVILGEDDDTPLNDSDDAATTDDNECMTYTFEDAGTYRVVVFEDVDLTAFEFGDDTNFANLTVVEANQDAGAAAQTTATPEATATTAATATVTNTATVTDTNAAAGAAATPGNLPTTGGETNSWVPVALMLGALALVAGGLMRFAFRNR